MATYCEHFFFFFFYFSFNELENIRFENGVCQCNERSLFSIFFIIYDCHLALYEWTHPIVDEIYWNDLRKTWTRISRNYLIKKIEQIFIVVDAIQPNKNSLLFYGISCELVRSQSLFLLFSSMNRSESIWIMNGGDILSAIYLQSCDDEEIQGKKCWPDWKIGK